MKARAKVTREADLTPYLVAAGFAAPVREHKFCPGRRWKFDYAWVGPRMARFIALEIEGGVHVQGRHTRGKGYEDDCRKYSIAAAMGWCVIRATPQQIESGEALAWLRQAFERQ